MSMPLIGNADRCNTQTATLLTLVLYASIATTCIIARGGAAGVWSQRAQGGVQQQLRCAPQHDVVEATCKPSNRSSSSSSSIVPYDPFNETNPHESWYPFARCMNGPTCQPCQRRFLLVMATGRSGSTSLMRMLDALPGVRLSGENNHELHAIHEAYNNVLEKDSFGIKRVPKGAWKHNKIFEGSLACPAQKIMEAMNPPPESDQRSLNFDDRSTIVGFKMIRFAKQWESVDEAVKFATEYFPCSCIVININSNTTHQAQSAFLQRNDHAEEYLKRANEFLLEAGEKFGSDRRRPSVAWMS